MYIFMADMPMAAAAVLFLNRENRVLHSPRAGIFNSDRTIGELVEEGDVIATVDGEPIIAKISGKLRGLLKSGLPTTEHFKVADIDPRGKDANHLTISDKAYAIAGGVLEVLEGFDRNMVRRGERS